MIGFVAAAVLIPAVFVDGPASSRAPIERAAAACAPAKAGEKTAAADTLGTAYGTGPNAGGCIFAWTATSGAVEGCPVTTAFGAAAGAQGRCVPARPK